MNDPIAPPPPGPPPGPPPPAPPSGGGSFGGGSFGGASRSGNAWDRRDEKGFGSAFVEAVKEFVTSPTEAFARTRETGDVAGPLMFAAVILFAATAVSSMWQLVFGGSVIDMIPPEYQDQVAPYLVGGGSTGCFGFVFGLVTALVFTLIGLLVWTAILHLSSLVVGGLKSSEAGFEGTLRVVSFASVAQLAGMVPIVGGLIAMVWSLILLVIGISSMHRTTTGTAVLAVLVPVVLCCVCAMAGVLLMAGGIAAAVGAAG